MTSDTRSIDFPTAGLLRRLAAAFYDALVVLALWMLTTALWLLLASHGEAIKPGAPVYHVYQLSLLLVAFGFFVGSWTRAGCTLGMQAWRLRLIRADGTRLRSRDAAVRFVAALLAWLPLGMGVLWLLVDRDRLTWQDRLSGTRVIVER
ncbi:MAG: RDD family protein [Nitrococcus sp.]|nr:RDD family protein [Nitrococcus sp.]